MSEPRPTLRPRAGPSASSARVRGAYPRDVTALRRTLAALLGAARGGVSVVAFLVVIGALVWLLVGRQAQVSGATTSQPTLLAAASDEPSSMPLDPAPTPQLGASEVATSPASSEPTLEATADPTATPVPATPKPTPRPTPRPTSNPTHDPAPEPTPRLGTASGSFGQTLSVDGVKVRMSLRDPSQNPPINCGTSDDPAMQGYTDIVSYDLRITWPDPADATEPWIAVGATPYHSLWFDPQVASGVDVVFATCKRPADSFKAMVELAPNGDPVLQRFKFS